jgi:hypothetical protein
MERMIKALDDHDARAKEIKVVVDEIKRVIRRRASDEPKTSDRQYLPKE